MSRSRTRAVSWLSRVPTSFPAAYSSSSSSSAAWTSRRSRQSSSRAVCAFPARPSTSSTRRLSTVPPAAAHWSSRLRASRNAPSASRERSSAPSCFKSMFSCPATYSSRRAMSAGWMRLKANRWHRERMVAGTLCSSVVARMKIRWAGGSSRIFSRALKAAVDSMWTSSMMYTR